MTYHFFMGSTFYIYTINLKPDMIGRKLLAKRKVVNEINIKASIKQMFVEKVNVY